MKKIILALLSSLFLLVYGCTNPEGLVNTSKNIKKLKSSSTINALVKNGYELAKKQYPDEGYVGLVMDDNSDIFVKVYASSGIFNVNAIYISVSLNEHTANTEADKDTRPLNEETFKLLKSSFISLPCSNDPDFLRSNFICYGRYKVAYQVNSDSLDWMRDLFGIQSNKEVFISIVPVE